ncbi:ferrochelatase [Nesterenkonia massiliensis]|uniref:Coproporphyrin III ferrochelatase n=2 Tax=Nesterenkonia massiliensis TaxID=1232429 RepID=A0ABT2HRR5_9MICC|nr:ferrochelatase [Nesterenkonia massiliensis]MCT1607366.1 ferrochelatase [Nesterenkonia massiliensis]
MAPKHYDALLLASFGGPEGQDDVIPFLRNVTAGRGIPDERLEEVATHYRAHGGVSPINDQNRALKAALEQELSRRGIELPVYWGNRNWDPYIPETLQEMYRQGHRRVLTVSTSAYSGYSSCRQYREDLGTGLRETGLEGSLEVDKVRQYFDHPGFVHSFQEGLSQGLRSMTQKLGTLEKVHVFFATHSIPTSDAAAAGPRPLAQQLRDETGAEPGEVNGADVYSAQHLAVAELLMEMTPEAKDVDWSLVYQSRSGPPTVPWLEPDINDAMEELAEQKDLRGVVVVPLGFVSDHMEVIWDLDTEAKETARELGLEFLRTPTPGVHQQFVSGLVDMVAERLEQLPEAERPERAGLTDFGPWFDVCRPNCCVKTMRDGTQKPTVAAVDSEVGVSGL